MQPKEPTPVDSMFGLSALVFIIGMLYAVVISHSTQDLIFSLLAATYINTVAIHIRLNDKE